MPRCEGAASRRRDRAGGTAFVGARLGMSTTLPGARTRERVIAATIRTGDGRVFGGAPRHTNHALVILDMLAAGVDEHALDTAEAGFATSRRPHVSRATAARVAGFARGRLDASYLIHP